MRNTNDHDGSSRGGSAAPYSGLTRSSGRFELWPYLVSLIAVAGATVVAWLLQPIAGLENVDLVFLTAIIAIAVRYGLRPSLIGSVASLLAYNFFFIPPLHTFAVAEPTNLAALFFFLLVAGITNHLAARIRAEALSARDHARTTEVLHAFSRQV
jgi:two-component system, OmpR family, sensor histidine kinase KdpD